MSFERHQKVEARARRERELRKAELWGYSFNDNYRRPEAVAVRTNGVARGRAINNYYRAERRNFINQNQKIRIAMMTMHRILMREGVHRREGILNIFHQKLKINILVMINTHVGTRVIIEMIIMEIKANIHLRRIKQQNLLLNSNPNKITPPKSPYRRRRRLWSQRSKNL